MAGAGGSILSPVLNDHAFAVFVPVDEFREGTRRFEGDEISGLSDDCDLIISDAAAVLPRASKKRGAVHYEFLNGCEYFFLFGGERSGRRDWIPLFSKQKRFGDQE